MKVELYNKSGKCTSEHVIGMKDTFCNFDSYELITEMALSMNAFSDMIHSQIFNVFTNLACICIYHDVNKQILPHWAERATEPFVPWFSQDIKKETAQKRTAAVNKGFEMMFNEDYSAIRIESFDNIIYYYANRPNKLKRMTAKNVAQYYYENYKDEIVKMLEEMKICIINRKYNDWADCVNAFCKKYQKS